MNEFYLMSLTDDTEVEVVLRWRYENAHKSITTQSLRTTKSDALDIPQSDYVYLEHGSVLTRSLACKIHMTELWGLITYLRDNYGESGRTWLMADSILDELPVVCYEDKTKGVNDKYTIIYTDAPVHEDYPNTWCYVGCNDNPTHPASGIWQHGELSGDPEHDFDHLGMRLELSEMPEIIQQLVVDELAMEVTQ